MSRRTLLALSALLGCVGAASSPHYKQTTSFPAPDRLWDYASVDADAHRLYVAGFGGVTAVDLSTGKVTPNLIRSKLVHGVAVLPHGMAAATNGEDNTVTLFDGGTGAIVATIPVGKGPDGISVEPRHGWLVVTEEDGDSLSIIDPVRRVRLKTVALGGAPEAAVADRAGTIFDNLGEKPEMVVVDPRKGAVVKRIALPVCDEPTGIAYEQRSDIVLSVCRNGTVNAVSARTRTVTDTLKVGAGPDAVMFDPTRGLFFVPSGATGELDVLQVRAGGKIKQVQRIATEVGSRTGAVDPMTGNVYVPAAKLAPPTKPGMRHSITPGTFHILVFKPG